MKYIYSYVKLKNHKKCFFCFCSLGETCSHVAAVLYKIEKAVRSGLTQLTPTDMPCQWNQTFTKNVNAAPVGEINFYSQEAKRKILTKTVGPVNVAATSDKQEKLLSMLNTNNNKIVALSLFENYHQPFIIKMSDTPKPHLPPNMRALYQQELATVSEEELTAACQSVHSATKYTTEELLYIEECTRNQSKSAAWFDQKRIGRITWSIAHQVLHTSIDNPSKSIIKKICQNACRSKINSPALQWGREHENEALMAYEMISAYPDSQLQINLINDYKGHKEFESKDIGLVVDNIRPWLAASPDGCIQCSCCGYGIVEVKCPYSLKETSLLEAIKSEKFYVEFVNNKFKLKKSH